MIDVLYLAHNRLEYTRQSWEIMLRNTDWSRVRRLVCLDDNSTDGTREWLIDRATRPPCEFVFEPVTMGSPVAAMAHYLLSGPAEMFAKIDNDIVLPPDWLQEMSGVMFRNPGLELLGMEAGQGGLMAPLTEDGYGRLVRGWIPATNIGGVGLFRTSAFTQPNRTVLIPDGRYGFTEWMTKNDVVRGWISPELLLCELSRVPEDPWAQLSLEYQAQGWERPWGKYDLPRDYYWSWWRGQRH